MFFFQGGAAIGRSRFWRYRLQKNIFRVSKKIFRVSILRQIHFKQILFFLGLRPWKIFVAKFYLSGWVDAANGCTFLKKERP